MLCLLGLSNFAVLTSDTQDVNLLKMVPFTETGTNPVVNWEVVLVVSSQLSHGKTHEGRFIEGLT